MKTILVAILVLATFVASARSFRKLPEEEVSGEGYLEEEASGEEYPEQGSGEEYPDCAPINITIDHYHVEIKTGMQKHKCTKIALNLATDRCFC